MPEMTERQLIPTLHGVNPDADTIERLITLYGDALAYHFEVNLNEAKVPGALYVLRLWASAQQLTLTERTWSDDSAVWTRTWVTVSDKPWFEVAVLQMKEVV